MIRKVFSLLPALILAFGFTNAQEQHVPCATSEVYESLKQSFPQIELDEQALNKYMADAMIQYKAGRAMSKGTADDTMLHVPVVVHIVHDYGNVDFVSDNDIYRMMDDINIVFQKRNADAATVLPQYLKYVANPNMTFHLATKDPLGRPTKGITRHVTRLTNGGDDQAKIGQWDPTSYLNIWFIQRIGRGISNGVVAAYATLPSSAGTFPYNDGIIGSASQMFANKTIPHEIGHILNLFHPWGNGPVATACGDDEVDDTPPTTGHFGNGNPYGTTANGSCNPASLYDTSCTNVTQNLAKILLSNSANPMVDYGVKGFDYIPRTNMVLESIKIYPAVLGGEYEITNSKYNRSTGNYDVQNVINTKRDSVGKVALGASFVNSNLGWTKDSAIGRISVAFNALKHVWIDSFAIYPSTIGDTFTITLREGNGNLVKSFTDTTSTNTGAQIVRFRAFIPNANGYRLQIERNPGLYCDSLIPATRALIDTTVPTAINIIGFIDTTNIDNGSGTTAYKGRYNFFYNWKVRYDALTTTDNSAQVIPLGFKVLPDTTYKLTLTKNPGVYNDTVGAVPYVKNISCVLDISNETTNNRYNNLYDLRVRYGYIKNCIDYPDTVNTENIMDYANCPKMFTELQVVRMRTALRSPIGNRNNLIKPATHIRTGIFDPLTGTYGKMLDLKPVPDLSVERATGGFSQERTFFMCAGENFSFRQRSWGDTVQAVEVSFNKGAASPTVSLNTDAALNTAFINSFSETGWVDVTVKATGNNTGDSSITMPGLVYVADGNTKINPNNGFFMEFDKNDQNNPVDKWPIFNYYKNSHKWELLDNVGYYDNACIVYRGYDKRTGTNAYTNSPKLDYDDFFTPAFDLSGMQDECRLNFMSSGAFTVFNPALMLDTLQISYSDDCGVSWTTLTNVTKSKLGNKGLVSIEYAPLHMGDWALQSFTVPQAARKDQVFFRFRFKPGVDEQTNSGLTQRIVPGTGNNFFIDRINISSFKLGVNTLLDGNKNIVLAPNPTNGGTQLVIKSALKEEAKVVVTDIAGKVVYTTSQNLNGSINTIEIPASAIKVKGVYMVQVYAGYERYTEKLVSY